MPVNLTRIEGDFIDLARLKPPVQRAAYSDRTAWLMAIFAELAYLPFDGSDDKIVFELAAELAQASGAAKSREIIEKARDLFRSMPAEPETQLRQILQIAGFELVGTFFNLGTEGFVASLPTTDERLGMAVLVFRGTTDLVDWKTNLSGRLDEIKQDRTVAKSPDLAGIHSGFAEAYNRVARDVERLIEKVKGQPLYIAGHSLGGALAVVATWRNAADNNAACYTFGSPRVGNAKLGAAFKTPIYRVVNAADPVPSVPPPGLFITPLRVMVGAIPGSVGHYASAKLRQYDGYRHYGDIRYFPRPRTSQEVPTLLTSMGWLERVFQNLEEYVSWRRLKKIAKYHDISAYRDRLRAYAMSRNLSLEDGES